mmetsp:Transcript_22917/g.64926  ORF Transcript_22917/g.64926 Transcript_22917/m.64926 type:complete len:332 (+) Transcript_22917:651-1646(+)
MASMVASTASSGIVTKPNPRKLPAPSNGMYMSEISARSVNRSLTSSSVVSIGKLPTYNLAMPSSRTFVLRVGRFRTSAEFSARILRPPSSLPVAPSAAALSSSADPMSTKAKPRDRPDSCCGRLMKPTVPYSLNTSFKSSIVTSNGRFPTNSVKRSLSLSKYPLVSGFSLPLGSRSGPSDLASPSSSVAASSLASSVVASASAATVSSSASSSATAGASVSSSSVVAVVVASAGISATSSGASSVGLVTALAVASSLDIPHTSSDSLVAVASWRTVVATRLLVTAVERVGSTQASLHAKPDASNNVNDVVNFMMMMMVVTMVMFLGTVKMR